MVAVWGARRQGARWDSEMANAEVGELKSTRLLWLGR